MKERRTLCILLAFLLLVLSGTLLLALKLDHTPDMPRIEQNTFFSGTKMELQPALDKVMDHFSSNQLSEAEKLLKELIKQYPANSDIWMLLGTVYYQQNKYPDAEASFRHLLRQKPNSAAGFNNLSETLIKLQRPDEAREAIDQAVKLAPNNAEILLNAASLYARAQDDRQALAYLKRAMDRGVSAETVSNYIDLVRLLERPDFMNYYHQQKKEQSTGRNL